MPIRPSWKNCWISSLLEDALLVHLLDEGTHALLGELTNVVAKEDFVFGQRRSAGRDWRWERRFPAYEYLQVKNGKLAILALGGSRGRVRNPGVREPAVKSVVTNRSGVDGGSKHLHDRRYSQPTFLQFGKPFNLLERRRVQVIDQGFSLDF